MKSPERRARWAAAPAASTVAVRTDQRGVRTGVGEPLAERIRLCDLHDHDTRLLCGLGHLHSDNGLTSRALRDVEAGIASGRFTTLDPTVALTALGGIPAGAGGAEIRPPDLDGDEVATNLAEMVLRMLGLPPDDADSTGTLPAVCGHSTTISRAWQRREPAGRTTGV